MHYSKLGRRLYICGAFIDRLLALVVTDAKAPSYLRHHNAIIKPKVLNENEISSILASFRDQFQDSTDNRKQFENKAQYLAVVSGVLVSALVTCYSSQPFRTEAGKLQLSLLIISLVTNLLTLLFSALAFKSSAIPHPPLGQQLERLYYVRHIVAESGEANNERDFYLDLFRRWNRAIEGNHDVAGTKSRCVNIALLNLVLAVTSAMLLLFISI